MLKVIRDICFLQNPDKITSRHKSLLTIVLKLIIYEANFCSNYLIENQHGNHSAGGKIWNLKGWSISFVESTAMILSWNDLFGGSLWIPRSRNRLWSLETKRYCVIECPLSSPLNDQFIEVSGIKWRDYNRQLELKQWLTASDLRWISTPSFQFTFTINLN